MAAAALLFGCSKPEPSPTVSWYLEHPDAMKGKVAWCADDAERRSSADCQNALEANGRKQLGRMKDLPPINWNTPDQKKSLRID